MVAYRLELGAGMGREVLGHCEATWEVPPRSWGLSAIGGVYLLGPGLSRICSMPSI